MARFLAASQREKLTADLDFSFHLKNPAYAKYRGQVDVSYLATVMLHIGRFPESYQRQEIICRTLKLPKRKLQRVIATLKALDILVTVRKHLAEGRSGGTNHHRINWEEVRRLVERQSQPFDLGDKRDALNARSTDDLGDKRVATYTTNEHDLGDKRVATYTTSVSPSLIGRNLEGRMEDEKNTPPPPPTPPIEASQVDQCQEEVGSGLVLIRTEKPRTPTQAPLAGLQKLAIDGRSLGSSIVESPQRPGARPLAELAEGYRRAGAYNVDRLLELMADEVGCEYLEELLDYWLANADRWDGAGALRTRLSRSRPGLAIADGWPPQRSPKASGLHPSHTVAVEAMD